MLLRRGLSTIRREYEQRVCKQILRKNESQLRVVDMMDDIRSHIERWNAPISLTEFERVIEPLMKPAINENEEEEEKLEVKKEDVEKSTKKDKEFEPPPPSPRGLYIYGTVGCGKSMIMDLFFSRVRVSDQDDDGKMRLHFETFMSEVHRTLHQWSVNSSSTDLENHRHEMLRAMARRIVERANVICFDEVQIPVREILGPIT